MSWAYNPSSWVNNVTVPAVSDYQNIAADIHSWGGNVAAGSYGLGGVGYLSFVYGDLPGTSYSVTAASWSSSGGVTATLTIGTHNIKVNQRVSISGITPTGYNSPGTDSTPITAVTSTTISFAVATNPGTYSSGGTVLVDATAASNGMIALNPSGLLEYYFGGQWNAILSSGNFVITPASLPSSPSSGQLAINSSNGAFEYYYGGSWNVLYVSGQSITITPATLPSSPASGQIAISSSGVLEFYFGSAWQQVLVNGMAMSCTTLTITPASLPGSPSTGELAVNASNNLQLYQGSAWSQTWNAVSFSSGWGNFGSPYDTAAYCIDAFGIVHLKGLVAGGTSTDGTTMFTLPAGFRPTAQKHFPCAANSTTAIASVVVTTGGAVECYGLGGASTYLSLEGITFSTF